jgi:hypothetical protein
MSREYIYLRGHTSPFVAELSVKLYDDPLLLGRKRAFLEIRPQMISPSQPTALPTPHQPAILLHRVPVPFPIRLHVLYQDGVLRSRPRPLLQPPARLGAASRPLSSSLAVCSSFPAFPDHPLAWLGLAWLATNFFSFSLSFLSFVGLEDFSPLPR